MAEELSIEQIVEMISRLMGLLEAEVFEQEGFSELSMRQLLYLETIAGLGRPTFSELAEKLGVTRPSVTALVQKLIRMGYVQKVQSDEDLRVYHIALASKGEQFTKMHAEMHRLIAQRLTENLSAADVQQFSILLQKVTQE
jgi:DNA-binding MarR family transcriptional regulator